MEMHQDICRLAILSLQRKRLVSVICCGALHSPSKIQPYKRIFCFGEDHKNNFFKHKLQLYIKLFKYEQKLYIKLFMEKDEQSIYSFNKPDDIRTNQCKQTSGILESILSYVLLWQHLSVSSFFLELPISTISALDTQELQCLAWSTLVGKNCLVLLF